MKTHSREISVAVAIVLLAILLAFVAPGYFSRENLTDLFLANVPVLIVALGMTLVIVTGEIDISVGSIFAICGVSAGLLAKSGVPAPLAGLGACMVGAAVGALNGSLVAYARMSSIVVTLASMVALRDALRWQTQGAWVQDLPSGVTLEHRRKTLDLIRGLNQADMSAGDTELAARINAYDLAFKMLGGETFGHVLGERAAVGLHPVELHGSAGEIRNASTRFCDQQDSRSLIPRVEFEFPKSLKPPSGD